MKTLKIVDMFCGGGGESSDFDYKRQIRTCATGWNWR